MKSPTKFTEAECHSRDDHWSLVVYRLDKRYKTGEVKEGTYDYTGKTEDAMKAEIRDLENTTHPTNKFRIELHKTWEVAVNVCGGNDFWERFDTPYYCSPSSETYWCS